MNTDITKQMEMVLYRTEDDNVTVSALIKDETIWITQKAMAELFGVQTPAISKHLKNIFEQGELREEVVVSKMEIPTPHGAIPGKTQLSPTNYYNLDAIISVGYRVNSIQATKFRIWATGILKEYMIKGFAMDDERLKQGKTAFGKDYFRELLERVRSIRASERRIWQQITDIFAECSIDYNRDSDTAYHFYATIQNKFHYAITGKTAAEIVYNQADHTKENMGLTTWKNAPDGRILKSDTPIAKNYLDEKQIRQLERAVTGYFDYIEDLIERENVFTMEEFSKSVNEFLAFRRYDILKDNGRVSHKQAVEKAYQEYDIFNKTQPIESDFDKIVKGLAKKKIITFPDYVIMIQLWKIVFYESKKSEFIEETMMDKKTQKIGVICSIVQIILSIICLIYNAINQENIIIWVLFLCSGILLLSSNISRNNKKEDE